MSPLTIDQKELIFEYSLGLTSAEQSAQAQQLISANLAAAELHATIKSSLSPLDCVQAEQCPDELLEGTLWRIENAESDAHSRLEELLAEERQRGPEVKVPFWAEIGRRLATAAVFVIVGSLLITTFKAMNSYTRDNAQRQMCAANLSSIYNGITNFTSDHDGKLANVVASTNAPWWKIGYEGVENHSNTRPLWDIVKMGYIEPGKFICPGARNVAVIDPSQIQKFRDFPSRAYIKYSFQVQCELGIDGKLHCRNVLMADQTPVFEDLPKDYSAGSLKIKLNEELLKRNSINHNRRGQSVLFGDGHAGFFKTRLVGIDQDDIYTLRDHNVYNGCERPSCTTDSFVAP